MDNRVKFRTTGRKRTTILYFAIPIILFNWMTRRYVPELLPLNLFSGQMESALLYLFDGEGRW
jgi:hypothetical protein